MRNMWSLSTQYVYRKNVYIDRAETILHDNFGDKYYWQARRSMRYQRPTPIHIADDFRYLTRKLTDNWKLNVF
jgi:hypothetical protein